MAGVITNRGKYNALLAAFRGGDTFYTPLFTSATTPDADDNTVGDLTQIATGNGYSDGGPSATGNSTDFDVLTEDDVNDRAYVQMADRVFTASGGPLPASGSGARYMGLSGAGGTVSTRDLWCAWDLGADQSVSSGQSLTVQDAEIRAA